MTGYTSVKCKLCGAKWSITLPMYITGDELNEIQSSFECPFGCDHWRKELKPDHPHQRPVLITK